jgi:hypothetical protein
MQACFGALCGPETIDYPFNSLATDPPDICTITAIVSTAAAAPGECATVGIADSGDRFDDCLDCTQNGRLCQERAQLTDGSEFCTVLTDYTDNITARYVDLSLSSGFKTCRHDSLTFADSAVGGMIPIEFPFMQLRGVTPNVPQGGSSLCGVRPITAPLMASYSFPSGAAGSLAMAGQTTASLTLAGGFATIGQLCFDEICQTELSKMRLVLGDINFAGFTLKNTQIETTRPRSLSGGTIPAGGGRFEVAVDVVGIGRAADYVTNTAPLTVTRTPSTIRLTGSFDYLARTSINTYRPITLTIDASGTVNPAAGSCGTATPLANLLGFETTQYWTSPQAPLAVTGTRKTQGCFGLQVGGSGYRTVNSAPFLTPLAGVTSTIGLDVFIPANQPNPSWLGAVQLYLSCPSAAVYNAYVGQVELTGKPQGAFSTASFTVPPSLVSVLNTAHPDCSFSIAVNMNQTPEPPVLDKLRFM